MLIPYLTSNTRSHSLPPVKCRNPFLPVVVCSRGTGRRQGHDANLHRCSTAWGQRGIMTLPCPPSQGVSRPNIIYRVLTVMYISGKEVIQWHSGRNKLYLERKMVHLLILNYAAYRKRLTILPWAF